MSADQLRDVRRHAVEDGVGDEQSSKIVGDEVQRLVGGVGEPGSGESGGQQCSDSFGVDRPVLHAVLTLEQQRHRRVPDAFVDVVGHHERHGAARVADAADDGGQYLGQLGADHQEPFGVGLRRGDLQQRDELTGSRQPVLDEAVMRSLGQFLDADAGMAQHFHRRPRPERTMLREGEVAALAGAGVLGPDLAAGVRAATTVRRRVSSSTVNSVTGLRARRRSSVWAAAVRARSTVRTRTSSTGSRSRVRWSMRDLRRERTLRIDISSSRMGRAQPTAPSGRVLHRPLGDVEVERPDHGQVVDPRSQRGAWTDCPPPAGVFHRGLLHRDALLPRAATSGDRRSESMPGW